MPVPSRPSPTFAIPFSSRLSGSRLRRRAALAALATAVTVSVTGVASAATPAGASSPTARPAAAQPGQPDFGPNVTIFDPSTPASQIQATMDAANAQMQNNEFGDQRYAFLFKPGAYNVNAQLGYYTTVAGLGQNPDDVTINGGMTVWAQNRFSDDRSSLTNFWRSAENLAIVPDGGTDWWAVSQAAPLRRVDIKGQLGLFDYLGGYASGGFIADSHVDSTVINAPQQQWLTRDSSIGSWSNGVWNQVFAGVQGAPPQSFPNPPYTTLPTDPASREKPYLYVDAQGKYNVFVPAARKNSSGTTWANGSTPGKSLPIGDFYIAKPTDSVAKINLELALGKNLIMTPGVYHVKQTIRVLHPDTIVLGMGMATIEPDNGVVAMQVADVKGVDVSGLIFDAGPVNSPALLQFGTKLSSIPVLGKILSSPSDPSGIQDVFFRIGGAHLGKATNSLVVNSNNVVLDDIWAWRADHGTGVGWTSNTAATGVLVNGNNVTATGLFVEHFQSYDVIWNGENGRTVMFQNEMPYDPPNQAAWQHNGVLGYAAYKVGANVKTHEGWGMGSYCFFNVDPTIHASHAFEVPVTPGVKLHDVLTVSLNNAGTIDHVVNDYGPATDATTSPSNVVEYPAP